ncbi:MAG: energy-coupling factor ABC transporter ATP-binding protein [Deltaproteobacteria bacterium]|jgi:biotin transport system ATP-binding protein|nr:energy-coupling factor ABC transporter ATP-binding protein [Deltaproteobacteria bacterium]
MSSPSVKRSEALLVVEDLSFAYLEQSPVLTAVSFSLDSGAFLGLAGANGSGKSTLLDLLAGLQTPTAGRITLAGRQAPDRLRRRTALVPQNVDHWILGATAREDLELSLERAAFDEGEPPDSLADLAERWGLTAFLDRPAEELSLGCKKRLALAGALARSPELVLLDEPFAGLDWPGMLALTEDLGRLRAQGRAVAAATHEPALVAHLADSWLLLKPGQSLWAPAAEALPRLAEFGARPLAAAETLKTAALKGPSVAT